MKQFNLISLKAKLCSHYGRTSHGLSPVYSWHLNSFRPLSASCFPPGPWHRLLAGQVPALPPDAAITLLSPYCHTLDTGTNDGQWIVITLSGEIFAVRIECTGLSWIMPSETEQTQATPLRHPSCSVCFEAPGRRLIGDCTLHQREINWCT